MLQEHRGNKLGLLIKVANMERLTEQFPDARVLYTWTLRKTATPQREPAAGIYDGGRDRNLAKGTPGPADRASAEPPATADLADRRGVP